MARSSERIPAHQRLRQLPPVFDIRDVEIALEIPAAEASVYCLRWRKAGLCTALGPRVGVHYNLVVDPEGPTTRRAEALEKALRRPFVVVGGAALHAHGWTNQRHHLLEVAVPVSDSLHSLPQMDGILLLPRRMSRFRVLAQGAKPGLEGMLVATPEDALADILLSGARAKSHKTPLPWQPDSDEVEIPDDDAMTALQVSLRNMGEVPEVAEKLASRFEVANWSSVRSL